MTDGAAASGRVEGFDVIGDVHGMAGPLESLLSTMGYRDDTGVWRHPSRQAIFVGDLVDRGPEQVRTVAIVRAMVEAGAALIVMGNHEFNSIAWATQRADGTYCREHTDKNRAQAQEFLNQFKAGSAAHRDCIDWFRTLPMWLDLGDLRIVHACWHPESLTTLGSAEINEDMITAHKSEPLYEAIEIVLKGPEAPLPDGIAFADPDGHQRDKARVRWWDLDAQNADLLEIPNGAKTPDGDPFALPEDFELDRSKVAMADAGAPIFFGHYWRNVKHHPFEVAAPLAACVDWSAVKGGPLVAYRWSGEAELDSANLIGVPHDR